MTYFSQAPVVEEIAPKLVGFIGVDGMSSLDLTGSLELFAAARMTSPQAEGRPCYEPMIIGLEQKTFVCDSGAVMKAQYTMRTAPALDTIIIPGGSSLRNCTVTQSIAAWLRERAQTTRRIAAIAGGIYPLASAGLLKGHCVTTHWRLAHDVARMFPELSVSTGAPFVKCGKVYTCGGAISGMEMSLALIEEDYGPRTAFAVARELSIDVRPAAEEQLDTLPQYQPGVSERMAELPAWMNSRLRRDLTVSTLAERACLSQRHFYRLFKRTFKKTPAAFVEQLRINEAQRRLAAQRDSIQSIAASVGFKSPGVFRRAFERQRGVSPGNVQRERRTPQPKQT